MSDIADAHGLKPALHSINSRVSRSEQVMHFICSKVLPKAVRRWMGAGIQIRISLDARKFEVNHLHLHDQVVCLVEIGLRQANPYRDLRRASDARSLCPASHRPITLFVQDMTVWGGECHSKSSQCGHDS